MIPYYYAYFGLALLFSLQFEQKCEPWTVSTSYGLVQYYLNDDSPTSLLFINYGASCHNFAQ